MSYYPKMTFKMNGYLFNFFTYFDAVLHSASSKSDVQKSRRRSSTSTIRQASPDSLNMRAAQRANNAVRRNPAP